MGVQWKTVLISIFSSLFVSMTTFILGLRAGKNQADRTKLKDLYRDISVHFREIEGRLLSNIPKQWCNYDLKHTLTSSYYLPLVRKMKKDGTLLEIDPKLANILEKCEIDCLNFGNKYQSFMEKIRQITIELTKEFAINPLTGQDYDIKTKEFVMGKQYKTKSNYFGVFCDKGNVDKLCNLLNSDSELVLRFELIRDGNKFYSLTIHEGTLNNMSLSDFVYLVYNKVSTLEQMDEIINEKQILLNRLKKVIKKVEKRARDPHTFFETVWMAFTDIFRI